MIDGLQDKTVDIQRCVTTPSGDGGSNRVWSTVLSGVICKIAKPSEEYVRQNQGANFVTDSVLYVNYGIELHENDRVVNIFDQNTGLIWQDVRNGVLVPVFFLVQTVENPGGESDYIRCSLKRWGGLEVK